MSWCGGDCYLECFVGPGFPLALVSPELSPTPLLLQQQFRVSTKLTGRVAFWSLVCCLQLPPSIAWQMGFHWSHTANTADTWQGMNRGWSFQEKPSETRKSLFSAVHRTLAHRDLSFIWSPSIVIKDSSSEHGPYRS